MFLFILIVTLSCSLLPMAMATLGFDGIQAISTSQFQCLAQNNHKFFIARVWQSNGRVDETGVQNIKNAKAANWQYVDGYIFPCIPCGTSGAAQITTTVNRLREAGANFGMLWLDIERLNWHTDLNQNRALIEAMANQLNAMNVQWGIYSNNNNWQAIVGLDYTKFSNKPLWWANYNGHQDYSGFVPFGGWSRPSIHQYQGTTMGPCGISMDLNYYP